MNRETERHFSEIPTLNISRSKFKRPFTHKTTFNAGELIPIYLDQDILPGDTVKINMSQVIRMTTPLYPVMDNSFIDIMFFFVPNRLLWQHWKEFWGENTNAWYQQIEYEIPQITTDETHKFSAKSIADYMGLPTNTAGLSVSALPFRALVKIYNDWFRDENLQQEAANVITDTNSRHFANLAYTGGALLQANKFHDYFSSCLPAPLKGNDVLIPLGTWAPVQTREYAALYDTSNPEALMWESKDLTTGFTEGNYYRLYGKNTGATDLGYNEYSTVAQQVTDNETTNEELYPTNLWANLSTATAATISQLRQAFAVQRFFEAQARGGSRYIEFIKNIFGVTSPDARLQRSEYLGGKRIPINVQQVLQTSSTNSTSPLGMTGAFSQTADSSEYFTKSFTEHGVLLGLACIRYDHSFNQGIERGWSRKKFTDFYLPQFAHLSEMPVLVKELYATGTSADEEVFGYQEAWADYRYKPNIVTSEFRTTYAQTLDAWHYADHYTQQPILGATWIQEDKSNIDRTLAVSSTNASQFIADFYFDTTYVRPMPIYSVPGLIDHM